MKKIIEKNYDVTVKRGCINSKTTEEDFILKIKEEVEEFIEANKFGLVTENEELADIILVCLNYAKHYGIDIKKELKQKINKNKKRL
tara:strand:+ start:120 stop:380 length:261 start_codon:yes stop_codon:yes gene_type:complete